jgi:MoaA/NifB/PqqE/SkfB family radical SAM enzyme
MSPTSEDAASSSAATESGADPAHADDHLLDTVRPREVLLELTSRCSLRCIYCAVSQPDYVGRDLEMGQQEIIDQLVALAPSEFQINGHGETSIVEGWDELALGLMRRGLSLTMTSHLNKPMSDKEIDVFARLQRITVSCDTGDPETYQRLRRGGRLERVANNITRILGACRREGIPGPYIAINCTTTHLNVNGIPELVAWAADLGVSGVALTNLTEYPPIPGCERPLHPTKVDPVRALDAVRRGRLVAQERGIDYETMGDLEESLVQACRERLVP